MTVKEAIRIVSGISIRDAMTRSRTSDNAAERMVCGWRVNEPEAFLELAAFVGAQYPVEVEETPAVEPTLGLRSLPSPGRHTERERVALAFLDRWRSMRDVALELRRNAEWVSRTLYRAHGNGYLVERRKTFAGLEWRALIAPVQTPPSAAPAAEAAALHL